MWPALRPLAVLFALLAVNAAMPRAWAEPAAPGPPARAAAVKKAKEHFQTGQRLFTVSRYREALEQFKNGFLAVEDPVFLFNIAQCHRLLGENAEAARFYRRFVEAAPKAPERARAEKWIAELEQADAAPGLSPPAVTGPPPPPARSAGGPLAARPTTGGPERAGVTPPPPPPERSAAISPPPADAEPTTTTVDLTARPLDAPAAAPIYRRWWFWAGVGAVVVLGGVVAATAAGGRPLTCGGGIQQCERL